MGPRPIRGHGPQASQIRGRCHTAQNAQYAHHGSRGLRHLAIPSRRSGRQPEDMRVHAVVRVVTWRIGSRSSYGGIPVIRWGRACPASGLSLPPEVPDDHHDPAAARMPAAPVFSNAERLALAGFLAGDSGLTREAYGLDLRRHATALHGCRSSPGRRRGRLLDHSRAVHVRSRRLDDESHATAWTAMRSARCWSLPGRPGRRARPDLPAGHQRAEGFRSRGRGHPGTRHRARPPHHDHHPQRRQGRHYPARAPHGPGDRPGGRRTLRRPDLPH